MKIAILTWNYPPKQTGGTEIATQNLAGALSRKGHEIMVVTTRDAGLPEKSTREGFRVHRVRSLRPKLLKYAFFCFSALKLLRRFNPDIIHAQAMWMGLPAFICKLVIKRPYIFWARGLDVYSPRLFKGPLSKLVLRNAAAVIALTENLKKKMQEMYNRDIFVIGNGVDIEKFGTWSKEAARAELNIKESEQVVIFVGSLIPVKGVQYLVEAMNTVIQHFPEARLLLVGDGEEREYLEKLADKLNLAEHITFIGRVANQRVPEYLVASDLFVLPSLSEGFPNVILEAMAAGLPIVTTNVSGLSEIVKDGENGFVVETRNPQQLAEKISLLLSDTELRNRFSVNNRSEAEQNSWEAVVEKLEKVYLNTTTVHS